jgi:hypothetical protein
VKVRVCVRIQMDLRMFEDDVAAPEYALVIQGGCVGGFVWWSDVCHVKNVSSLDCHSSSFLAR